MAKSDTKIWAAILGLVVLAGGAAALLPLIAPTPPAFKPPTTRTKLTAFFPPVMDLYFMHVGEYPSSLNDLTQRPVGVPNWLGPYVKSDARIFKDSWGQAIRYKPPEPHNPGVYRLWSIGPDGVDGTADDIVFVAPSSQPDADP